MRRASGRKIISRGRPLVLHWVCVARRRDDGYIPWNDAPPGKLSGVIAIVSPTSTLIHTGLTIQTEGTPVATVGLPELGIDVDAFDGELLRRYADKVEDIWLARCNIRAMPEEPG